MRRCPDCKRTHSDYEMWDHVQKKRVPRPLTFRTSRNDQVTRCLGCHRQHLVDFAEDLVEVPLRAKPPVPLKESITKAKDHCLLQALWVVVLEKYPPHHPMGESI